MATTTNYSWTTPDDTALVKDGASAIRSLGTAIDTTVFNNANAAIAKTIVDAKGDIIAATAADTVSRLAVGSNNTVLTADSTTATGLKWATPAATAAPWTKTTSGSLSGSSVSITGLTKNDIMITVSNYSATATGVFAVRWNDDSGGNYGPGLDNTLTRQETFSSIGAGANGQAVVSIQNAQSNQAVKMTWSNLYTGYWNNSAAVSSATLIPTAGSFDNGSYEVWER